MTTTPPPPAAGDELVAAWEEVLDVLERDAHTAAELAGDPRHDGAPALAAWTPPAPGGPVPDVLVDRVRELLELQAAVRADLDRAMVENRGSLADLARTASPTRLRAAAYVDVSA
ncbi:conserved hypothetical protein [metagenome]|uniref:Uncharacterized protein n=1 Tax=metagenome TaxID=256318 RepID=A0A2P2CJK7_9ZZZZ